MLQKFGRGVTNNEAKRSRGVTPRLAMPPGKPRREDTKAIPASYIRPRDGPDGNTTYNVRAYDPKLRKCKTLGTFKTKREAEAAFRTGKARLALPSSPSIAATASGEPHVPGAPSSVTRKRARSPTRTHQGARTSPRLSAQTHAHASGEAFGQNDVPPKRRKTQNSRATAQNLPPVFVTPPALPRAGRRASGAIRALASAAAAVSPLEAAGEEISPARPDGGGPKTATDFVTPLARTASPSENIWSRVRAFIHGGEYPVAVPELGDGARAGDGREAGYVPGRESPLGISPALDIRQGNSPGEEDSPGPAERLAAFLASAARRLRRGAAAAAGLEPRLNGVSVMTQGMVVTVDVVQAA